MKNPNRFLAGAMLCLFAASAVFSLAVPLKVKDPAAFARVSVPLMNGVPLPEGAFTVADTSKFTIQDSVTGAAVPAGFRPLAYWPNKSIKFLGVMFQATVASNATATYMLTDNSANPVSTALSAVNAGGVITVNTGKLRFTVKSANFNIIDEAWVDLSGAQSYTNANKVLAAGNASLVKSDAGVSTGRTAALSIEYQNREQVCIRAAVSNSDDKHRYTFYITAFRNKPYVKITHDWVYNQAANALLSLNELNLTFKTLVTGSLTTTFSRDSASLTTANAQMNVTVASGETATETYTIANSYTIKRGATTLATGIGQNLGTGGTKKMGWVHATNGTVGFGTGLRYFWEMAPKHLEVKGDGTVEMGLYSRYHTPIPWYGGGSRTHITFVSFGTDVNNTKEAFYAVSQPLMAIPPAVWMCGMTKAFGDGVVHPDANLFTTDATVRTRYLNLFNCYKANLGTHGYNAYKAPLGYPYAGLTDLHNFVCFGNNVEPVNQACGANTQHFSDNYYDFPWLCAITFALTVDYRDGLFGMERALQCADVNINNITGDPQTCPGIQNFFDYRYCAPGNAGSTNHWKTLGIFYWYFLYGEPILKEKGIRLTQYPMTTMTNWEQPRGGAHAVEGMTAAFECTGDSAYLHRSRLYCGTLADTATGGYMFSSMAYNGAYVQPSFQSCIVGEGIAYFASVDRNATDIKAINVMWATQNMRGNTYWERIGDLPWWGLAGFAGAINNTTDNTLKNSIKAFANVIFDSLLRSTPAAKGRQKDQCEHYKDVPQFFKYKLLDPNYLSTFPAYATNKITTALDENGPGAVAVEAIAASPNPFNPEVRLTLVAGLRFEKSWTLKVYDASGRQVVDLTANVRDNQTVWNAKGLPSGVYMVKLAAGSRTLVKRITLLK